MSDRLSWRSSHPLRGRLRWPRWPHRQPRLEVQVGMYVEQIRVNRWDGETALSVHTGGGWIELARVPLADGEELVVHDVTVTDG